MRGYVFPGKMCRLELAKFCRGTAGLHAKDISSLKGSETKDGILFSQILRSAAMVGEPMPKLEQEDEDNIMEKSQLVWCEL